MGLISRLKCCFKRIYEKNLRNFSLRGLSFVVADEMFIKVPLFSETSPVLRNSWLRP